MSFHISFAARTAAEARAKLTEHHAPAVVKALIEKALDAIPAPKPTNREPHGASAMRVASLQYRATTNAANRTNPERRAGPEHFGVIVDVQGISPMLAMVAGRRFRSSWCIRWRAEPLERRRATMAKQAPTITDFPLPGMTYEQSIEGRCIRRDRRATLKVGRARCRST